MKPWEKYQQTKPWERYSRPTQATHGLPHFAGTSPMGAELPLREEPPIPEVTGYGPGLRPITGVRETPRSTTPGEALRHATAGEARRMMLGIQALSNLAMGQWSSPQRERLEQLGQESSERFSEFPFSTLAGQASPYLAAPVSTMPRAALFGGTIGGIGSGGDPLQTLIGTGAGAAGYGVGRALAGPTRQLNTPQRRDIAAGRQIGFRTTPAMETGSPGLMRAESAMESSPLMQGTVTATRAHNQAQMNKIAAESIGETADYVDESLIGLAQDRIGNTMRDIASQTTGRVDDELLDAFIAIDSQISSSVVAGKKDVSNSVAETLDNILDKADESGTITGRELAKISSDLRKDANNLYRNPSADKDLAAAYLQMSQAVDDFIARNAPTGQMERLMEARQQWGNTMLLQTPGAHNGAGDVSARTLRNMMIRQRPSFRKGRGAGEIDTPQQRLAAATRFQTSVPAPYGSSGTAERMAPAQAAAAWYGGTELTGEPVSGAVVGLGAPALLSRLYGRYPFATGAAVLPYPRTLRPFSREDWGALPVGRALNAPGAVTGLGASSSPLLEERLR